MASKGFFSGFGEAWMVDGPAAALGVPPGIMGIGPAPAMRRLLERAGVAR